MKKFEYRFVSMKGGYRSISSLTDELNDLGLDGWELVAIDYGCWILKRERQSEVSKLGGAR